MSEELPLKAPERVLTIPNVLTMGRLATIPFFLVASFRGFFATAFILFLSAAVTDIIDGFIARRLNQRSRLGALLDPAADKTMLICGYLFYTLAPGLRMHIPGWLTFVLFVRDFLIMMFAILLFTRVRVTRFPPSVAGKISTLLQVSALAAVIGVNAFGPGLRVTGEVLFRAALVVTLFSSWDYLRRAERMLLSRVS